MQFLNAENDPLPLFAADPSVDTPTDTPVGPPAEPPGGPPAERAGHAPEDARLLADARAGRETLLPWARWLALRDGWPDGRRASVALPNDLDVRDVLADLPRLARIALVFPKWTDGRAYSQARLLRVRHRYGGELRAIGQVIPDMAAQLRRTGFDHAVLRTGERIEVAERMLNLIPVFYQADADEPRLRFARAEAAA